MPGTDISATVECALDWLQRYVAGMWARSACSFLGVIRETPRNSGRGWSTGERYTAEALCLLQQLYKTLLDAALDLDEDELDRVGALLELQEIVTNVTLYLTLIRLLLASGDDEM